MLSARLSTIIALVTPWRRADRGARFQSSLQWLSICTNVYRSQCKSTVETYARIESHSSNTTYSSNCRQCDSVHCVYGLQTESDREIGTGNSKSKGDRHSSQCGSHKWQYNTSIIGAQYEGV